MRFYSILLCLFTTGLLLAQTQKYLVSVEEIASSEYFLNDERIPHVNGLLLNLPEEADSEMKIEYTLISPFRKSRVKKSATVQNDGSFTLELDHAFPYQQVRLDIANVYYSEIYVNQGVQIVVDLEEAKNSGKRFYAPGIQFSGPDADLNRFMYELYWSDRKDRDNISRALSTIKSNRDIPIKKYTQSLDSLYESLAKLDESYIKKNPSTYSWLIKNERISNYYGDLLYKYWGKKMEDTLWDEVKKHKVLSLSGNGTNFYNYLFIYLQQRPNVNTPLDVNAIASLIQLNSVQKEKIDEFKSLVDLSMTGKALDTVQLQQLSKELSPIFNKYFSKKDIESDIALIDSISKNTGALVKVDSLQKKNLSEFKNLLNRKNDVEILDTLRLQQISDKLTPLFETYLSKKQIESDITLIDSLFEPSRADFLKLKITSEDLKKQKIIDEMVLKTLHTPLCKIYLEKLIKENQAKLDEIHITLENATVNKTTANAFGKPIMEFDFGAQLYEVKDLTAEQLLTKIKSSFKDKALLFDFWAVWCAPCLRDFPYSKKLHEAAGDEPIEFVYLCTSSSGSQEQWKDKIAQFKLNGIHLFVEESVEAELLKQFNGYGFPTYAFINKNGVISGDINIQDVSQEELIKLIHED